MKNIFLALFVLSAANAFSQSANMLTVMNNYTAFGKGDIPTIIASFTEDCTWTHPGSAAVPFAGTYRGHAGLAQFFENVGKATQLTQFDPVNFRESGNTVINEIHVGGTVLSTGKFYASVMTFTWTFNAAGKATSWVASGDIDGLEAAFSK